MDKMEEIYDKIVDAKNKGVKDNVLQTVNVDDTSGYTRVTTNVEAGADEAMHKL